MTRRRPGGGGGGLGIGRRLGRFLGLGGLGLRFRLGRWRRGVIGQGRHLGGDHGDLVTLAELRKKRLPVSWRWFDFEVKIALKERRLSFIKQAGD